MISNSDVVFKKNTINTINNYFDSNDDITVIAPKIVDVDGTDLTTFIPDINFFDYFFNKTFPKDTVKNRKMKKARTEASKDGNIILFEGMPSGCCFAIRSETFTELGLFDENVFLYYEENILAYKLKNLSCKSAIINNIEAIHKHIKSKDNTISGIGALSVCHSLLYYMRKYKNINNMQWFIIFIPHAIRYLLRSLSRRDYKDNLKKFLNQCYETLKL